MDTKIIKISKAEKYSKNPFLKDDIITINTGKKQIIAGSTKQVLLNSETGEVEGITLLHKYKEVDKEHFVKLFVNEVQALFDLSRTGLKVFGFVLNCLRINTDEVYINYKQLMEYCGYKQPNQVYKGLGELMANKIIAMSKNSNIWYINPNIVFNGDRIAFVKEYRLKKTKELPLQSNLEFDDVKEI